MTEVDTATVSPIDELAGRFWEAVLALSPTTATMYGDDRYDDRLEDPGPVGRARARAVYESFRAEAHATEPAGIGVLARRQADQPLEGALQVIRASAEPRRERREGYAAPGALEIGAGSRNAFDPRIGGGPSVGPAASAGAIASALCVAGRREERHLAGCRAAARTRGTAVDARRQDGIDERAVGRPVAFEDGPPARPIDRCA